MIAGFDTEQRPGQGSVALSMSGNTLNTQMSELTHQTQSLETALEKGRAVATIFNKRRKIEQQRANRKKHAENGNPATEERKAARKARKTKKKKQQPEKRKAARKSRGEQLARQLAFLKVQQAEGKYPAGEKLIRGRGPYSVGEILPGLAADIGQKAGSWLGTKAMSLYNKIFGTGDYMIAPPNMDGVTTNSLMSGAMGSEVKSSDPGSVDFCGYEFLGQLSHTVDFNVNTFEIDITNSRTFPWLYRASPMFQQWQLKGLVIFIKSISSEFTTANSLGSVGVTVSYDPDEPAPITIEEALNRQFSQSRKISESFAAATECRRDQTIFPTMKIPIVGQHISSEAEYKFGKFYVYTSGADMDYENAFQVYLIHNVTMLKQRIEPAGGAAFMLDLAGDDISAPLKPVADSDFVVQPRINTVGATVSADQTKLTFPLGMEQNTLWKATYVLNGAATSNIVIPGFAYAGGLHSCYWTGDQTITSVATPSNTTNTGCTSCQRTGAFTYDGSGSALTPPTFTFSLTGTNMPSSPVPGTLLITQVPAAVDTGISSTAQLMYTRTQLCKYLSAILGKRPTKGFAPPRTGGTLADWTYTMSRLDRWPLGRKPKRSPQPFDLTPREALAQLLPLVLPEDDEEKTAAGFTEPHASSEEHSEDSDGWIDRRPTRLNTDDCVRATTAARAHRLKHAENGNICDGLTLHEYAERLVEATRLLASLAQQLESNIVDYDGATIMAVNRKLDQTEREIRSIRQRIANALEKVSNDAIAAILHTAENKAQASGHYEIPVAPESDSKDHDCTPECPQTMTIQQRRELARRRAAEYNRQRELTIAHERACREPPKTAHPEGDPEVREEINGANGEKTGKDDVVACSDNSCGQPTHFHRKKRSGGLAAQKGAAQRVAEAKATELEQCVDELGQVMPIINGECPLGRRGRHFHMTNRERFEVDLDDQTAVSEMSIGQIRNQLRKITAAGLRTPLPSEDECPEDDDGTGVHDELTEGDLDAFAGLTLEDDEKALRITPLAACDIKADAGEHKEVLDPTAVFGVAPPARRPRIVVLRGHPDWIDVPEPPPGPVPEPPPPFPNYRPGPQPPPRPPGPPPNFQAAPAWAGGHQIAIRRRARALRPVPAAAAPIPEAPDSESVTRGAAILDDLANKMDCMLLTKNLTSNEDFGVVKRGILAIARKEEAVKYIPDFPNTIEKMFNTRLEQVTEARLRAATIRSAAIKSNVLFQIYTFVTQMREPLVSSRLDKLQFAESQTAFSRVPDPPIAIVAGAITAPLAVLATAFVVVSKLSAPMSLMAKVFGNDEVVATLKWAAKTPNADPEAWGIIKIWLFAILVSPVQEEVSKRVGVWLASLRLRNFKEHYHRYCAMNGAVFGLAESVQYGQTDSWKLFLRTAFHALTAWMSLRNAIALHTVWNAATGFGALMQLPIKLSSSRLAVIEACKSYVRSGMVLSSPTAMVLKFVAASVAAIGIGHMVMPKPIEMGTKVVEDICLNDYDVKTARTQGGFKVRYGEAVCKPAHGATGCWGVKEFVGTVFRTCSHNEKISMCGRVGKFLPAHVNPARTQEIADNWSSIADEQVQQLAKLGVPFQYQPMPYAAWCETFPPARRDLLKKIADNADDMPPLHAKSFIKKEIAVKDECRVEFKDPRFIQGCPPQLSARVGPYLRKWVKELKAAWQPDWTESGVRKGKQIVYTCGMDAISIGDSFAKACELVTEIMPYDDQLVFLEDDQSRFDLHLLSGPFHFLNLVYRRFLPRKVAALLKRKVSRGTSCLGTRYSIPYTMQSGWPDTSCGDTLVNAAMKNSIHGIGRNWVSIICGDDSVTITTRSEIERIGGIEGIIRKYADFGMEIEAKLSSHPLDVEFCSGRFYPANSSYILMPKPGRMLSKICWDMHQRNAVNRVRWLRSIGITLLEFGKIDPVLRALGGMIIARLGEGDYMTTKVEYKYYIEGYVARPRTDEVLDYYHHHYGFNADDVAHVVATITNSYIGHFTEDARIVEMARADM